MHGAMSGYQFVVGAAGLTEKDAIACFKVAAQAGIYTAYTDLGNLYQQAKQYKKALEAYQKAADKGDDAAMI